MSLTAARPARLVGRLRAWAAHRDVDELALCFPLLIALIYLGRLGQTFQERFTVIGWDSDAITPLFIAATMDDVPDADVNMGTFGTYITLWYARATEWLPFDREIWEVIPPALWLASLGIVVWAAWRTFGGQPAILTGVLGLCASPSLLYLLFSSSHHTWTLYCSAIAVGLVVYLTRQTRMTTRAWVVVGAATLVLGGALASDRHLLVGAIGPLLIAGAGVAIRHPTRHARVVGLVAGGVSVAAGMIAVVVTYIMEASGFDTIPRTEGFAEAHLFVSQAGTYFEETLRMLNGYFFGRELSLESSLTFATAAGVVAALIAPFVLLRRRLSGPEVPVTPQELGQSAYIFFWAATMALVLLAAVASAQNAVVGGARYLLPVLFAAAATVPLLARSVAARYLVIVGVSIYAVVGVVDIDVRGQSVPGLGLEANADLQSSADRIAIQANELTSIAQQEQAHIGYAGYWEAAASSWSTKMELQVFPVDHYCESADDVPCPISYNRHRGWYVPRTDIRTFLISPRPDQDPDDYEPPAALGPPLSTHRLSSGLDVYVYPYDIAERLPPS